MICPITHGECSGDKCGWWSEDSQKCAVLVAAENLKKGVELEGFKLSLGDIFFGMVVDRVIERVEEQPTVGTREDKHGLKPCPFCGGRATVMQIPDSDLWTVGCDDELMCWGNINHITMVFCTEENAQKAWNRRCDDGNNEA